MTNVSRWIYAYDGSGVQLSAEAEILEREGTALRVRVRATDDVIAAVKYAPPAIDALRFPVWAVPGWVDLTVSEDEVTQGRRPEVASFGWLD